MDRLIFSLALSSLLLLPHAAGARPVVEIKIDETPASAAHTAPAIFRFGGGIWHVPGAFRWMEKRIWRANASAGTYRLALAWEILAPATNLDDLKTRLSRYALNEFAREVERRGGTLVICVDAMPQWLAADPNRQMLADGPAWAKSPPRDLVAWSDVMSAIVGHFNGTLNLSPYYEIWNEPDWAWRGSMDQFLQLYRASVVGALKADARARVGGPAISDWLAMGTVNNKSKDSTFLQQLFRYAAKEAVPELGLTHLPIAMVSWHAYGRDPGSYHALAVPVIRTWLKDAGYDAATPLVIDEWNVFPEPPYLEGALNANHVGAALVTSTLISMWKAGLDHHSFQLVADPGTPGYTGGVFTTYSAPRASWNSFELASKVRGVAQTVTSSDPWVQAAAFKDGARWYILVSSFVPTDSILLKAVSEPEIVAQPEMVAALRRFDQKQLVDFFVGSGATPRGASTAEREFLSMLRERFIVLRKKKNLWKDGIEISIELPPSAHARGAHRYVVDAQHSVTPNIVSHSRTRLEREIGLLEENLNARLKASGLPSAIASSMQRELQENLRIDHTTTLVDEAQQKTLRAIFQRTLDEYGEILGRSILDTESAPYLEPYDLSGSNPIRVDTAPYSVQLFVIGDDGM